MFYTLYFILHTSQFIRITYTYIFYILILIVPLLYYLYVLMLTVSPGFPDHHLDEAGFQKALGYVRRRVPAPERSVDEVTV